MLAMLSLCLLVANSLTPGGVQGLSTSQSASDTSTPSSLEANKIDVASSELDESDERHLSRSMEHPRQLFKLKLLDSSSKSRPDSGASSSGQKRLAFKQAMRRNMSVRQHSPAAASGAKPANDTLRGPVKQLSSAALKKLLNQALASGSVANKSHSANSSSDLRSSNFKFVFIQKAAPANNSVQAADKQTGAKQSTAKPAKSLAASVSKQLATSLLYSAASLVGNFTGSSASLSSLASQLAAPDGQSSALGPRKSAQSVAKIADSSASQAAENSLPIGVSDIAPVGELAKAKPKSKQQGEISAKKVKKNSRIYNLPVKFVSNGQPSQILVLNSLKQHFAAIKRLQTAATNLSSLAGVGASTRHKSNPSNPSKSASFVSGPKKSKKPSDKNSLSAIKIKGVNSRLIYLPLRFLANGQPSRLTLSKSKHSS